MDLTDARTILGVSPSDDWPTVRDAYRRLIRTTHPDLVGARGIDRTVAVNDAYRTLALAHRSGRLHAADAAPPPGGRGAAPGASSPPPTPRRTRPPPHVPRLPQVAADVRTIGGDTIVLGSPPPEAFRRMVEATHLLGDISYVDRSSAIFEAVLALEDGNHASFVVSLQWRAHDATCEAFCTLEALDRAEHLDVSGVLGQLIPLIPPDPDATAG